MLTPPPSNSLFRQIIQEKKFNLFMKAKSKEKYSKNHLVSKQKKLESISAVSSRSFMKKHEKPANCKIILAPKSLKHLEPKVNPEGFVGPRFPSESNFFRNKVLGRSETPGVKILKKEKKIDSKGLQSILNELLVDKKSKCSACGKCLCECENSSKDTSKKPLNRKKTDKRLSNRLTNESQNENIEQKPEEKEVCIINKRKISFSSFYDKSFSKIHSHTSQNGKHHTKIRSNNNKITKNMNSNIDLIISVSPVSFSQRQK